MNPMSKKARPKSKRPVDAAAGAVAQSPREKARAKKTGASHPGPAGAARENAAAFRAAARFIRGGESADRPGAQGAERREREQGRGAEWALAQGRLIHERDLDAITLLSNSTSEHEVRYPSADGRVVKKTWPGFYGQIPVWRSGRIEREPALPSQYLDRQALQNEVFGSDLRLEGVTISERPSMIIGERSGQPSFVVSQRFIEAADPRFPKPNEAQLAAFLEAHGFQPLPRSYFGWLRALDGIVVLDARADNFILSAEGVIPIDLQMAVIPAPRS